MAIKEMSKSPNKSIDPARHHGRDEMTYLEIFIERNALRARAKWSRFLYLEALRRIHTETKIRELELNPSCFKTFCFKYRSHLKHIELGEVEVKGPIPITIMTDKLDLATGYTRSSGRKEMHPILRKKIKELSIEGLSQRKVARFLGIGIGTVNKYLQGDNQEVSHIVEKFDIIYFIRANLDGPIKIGISKNVDQRLKALQTGSDAILNLLGVITNATIKQEKEIHIKFKNARLHGEWFKPTPASLKYIKENAKGELEINDPN